MKESILMFTSISVTTTGLEFPDKHHKLYNWASEASPTLGCSIEISRDIYMCVCRMSNHVESRESNTGMLKVSIGR